MRSGIPQEMQKLEETDSVGPCLFALFAQQPPPPAPPAPPASIEALLGSTTAFMATIYPFRALRYNPAAVRPEDVVAQLCGTISYAMQQADPRRSPFILVRINLVRVILGLPALFDAEKRESVYPASTRQLRETAFAGRIMPRKSTHFCPMPLSGLAISAFEWKN